MSSQKHKTKDGNVMSFIIQRLEANGELSTKLRMRVKIWLKYVKTVILRRTTSSHATLCSIMQLGADKEAAIVIQILNSIAHFCLVAFKPLWHHWIDLNMIQADMVLFLKLHVLCLTQPLRVKLVQCANYHCIKLRTRPRWKNQCKQMQKGYIYLFEGH